MKHIAADSTLVSQGNVSMEPFERQHSVRVRGGCNTGELKRFVCLKPLIRISLGKGQIFTAYHHVTLWETTAAPYFHLLTGTSRIAPAWCLDWFLDIKRHGDLKNRMTLFWFYSTISSAACVLGIFDRADIQSTIRYRISWKKIFFNEHKTQNN